MLLFHSSYLHEYTNSCRQRHHLCFKRVLRIVFLDWQLPNRHCTLEDNITPHTAKHLARMVRLLRLSFRIRCGTSVCGVQSGRNNKEFFNILLCAVCLWIFFPDCTKCIFCGVSVHVDWQVSFAASSSTLQGSSDQETYNNSSSHSMVCFYFNDSNKILGW